MWHTIGGVIKYFRFTYDYVLYGISYRNLLMLLSTIPVLDNNEEKEKTGGSNKGGMIEVSTMEDFMKLGIR